MGTGKPLFRSRQPAPMHGSSLGLEAPCESGLLNRAGPSAGIAAGWNERVNRLLDEYPEARPFGELRQEWRRIYERLQMSEKAEAALGERERAARLRMSAAYDDLPMELKIALAM